MNGIWVHERFLCPRAAPSGINNRSCTQSHSWTPNLYEVFVAFLSRYWHYLICILNFLLNLTAFSMLNTTGTVVFVPLHETVYLGSMLFSETVWQRSLMAGILADLRTKTGPKTCRVLLLFGAFSKTNLSKHRILQYQLHFERCKQSQMHCCV